jgi:hypothetical protein
MAFSIVEGEGRTFWAATNGSSTYYVGQLVSCSAASKAATAQTVVPLAVPAGVADTTNLQVIIGVITAINDRTPSYDSTGQKRAGVTTKANQLARDWTGQEGMYVKGDPQVLVQVTRITSSTVIRGNIFNAAVGTAPTVVADTVGTDSTGYTSAGTTGACDFTPTTLTSTIYCRSGANAGLYRVTTDTSTTAPAVTVGFPTNVALGDKFVRVPLKQGLSHVYIGGPGLYIDCSLGLVTNTYQILVWNLNLATAGSEYADFSFTPDHFCYARA